MLPLWSENNLSWSYADLQHEFRGHTNHSLQNIRYSTLPFQNNHLFTSEKNSIDVIQQREPHFSKTFEYIMKIDLNVLNT